MPILNDPIGDLVTRMRNAQHARRETCRAPWSRIKQQLCELLKREGWILTVISSHESGGDRPGFWRFRRSHPIPT